MMRVVDLGALEHCDKARARVALERTTSASGAQPSAEAEGMTISTQEKKR
jgi:hypothetical protein